MSILALFTLIGLRGCNGDHAVAGSGWRDKISESELRRFFLGSIAGFVGVFSPMLLRVDVVKCELPGRDLGSSSGAEPEVVGLSREIGLKGGSIRPSISVDRDLTKLGPEALERLGGCECLSPGLFAFLLNVRHMDATFDSDSFLLFSRVKVPKPNFLRNDEVFELIDPVLNERVRDKDPVAEVVLPSVSTVVASSKRPS